MRRGWTDKKKGVIYFKLRFSTTTIYHVRGKCGADLRGARHL